MTSEPTCKERRTCRLCGSAVLTPALTLTPTPPANAFVTKPEPQECFPLEVRVCAECGHSQLGHVVSGLFNHYSYVSGTSASFREHFAKYALSVSARVGLQQGDLVVEIGSNDQTCLKNFTRARKIGIEPAENLAKAYLTPGIVTLNDYFSVSLALGIRDGHGPAKLILANNVMAHIDDLGAVLDGVKTLLDTNGLFVFEVQYLGALLDGGMFDMVYHEHLDFHAVTPLIPFLARHGLTLLNVERVPTHGGSIRCYARHARPGVGQPLSVDDICSREANAGLLSIKPWKALRERIDVQRVELHTLLGSLKTAGRTIVGYGAPAKLTTFMYEMQLGSYLDYVVDDSPLKQGLYTPGMHIPVLPSSALYEEETGYPDLVVVTAWNFASQIIAQHQPNLPGVHWATPFPALSVTP